MGIVIRVIASYGRNYQSSVMFKRSTKIKNILGGSGTSSLQSELKKNTESEIADPIREDTPVRTGDLKKGTVVEEGEKGGNMIASVVIKNEVEYGPYVEFGTYKMEKQPFFWPNIKSGSPGLISKIAQSVINQTRA